MQKLTGTMASFTPSQGPLTTDHDQMEENHHNKGGSIDPDDPLLIAQTLTYVTDNGSVVMSYSSAPFSFGKLALGCMEY